MASIGTDAGERTYEARGGISLLSAFTGVLVALGTLFLLSALVAGVIEALDDLDTSGDTVEIGVGAGIAFIVAQLIAYLWGGYTAARMGRGAGVAHGLLVPLFALLLAAIVAGIATALGAVANLGLPFTETRFPVERDYLIDWGAGVGIGSLVAMFLGGVIGGVRGARWHSRLEADKRAELTRTDEVATERTAVISEETVAGDTTPDHRSGPPPAPGPQEPG
jgi:hypothetical protein